MESTWIQIKLRPCATSLFPPTSRLYRGSRAWPGGIIVLFPTQCCQEKKELGSSGHLLNAFDALKNHLVYPPILGHLKFTAPFLVYTDSSEVGLGAVLVQKSDLGTEEVFAFTIRTLSPTEKHYTATELECLDVVRALEKWRTNQKAVFSLWSPIFLLWRVLCPKQQNPGLVQLPWEMLGVNFMGPFLNSS